MTISAVHGALEEVKQQLREALEACEATKKPEAPPVCDRSNIPDGYWMDSSCKLHRSTRFFGHVNLGAIASNVPRVGVDPGGGLAPRQARETGPKKKPKNVDPLIWKLQLAIWECRTKQTRINAPYYRCLAKENGTQKSCKSLWVEVECPDVAALQQQIDERSKARGESQPSGNDNGFLGRGGGFGGGGASGTF